MRYIFMGNENSYLNRAFVNSPDKEELAHGERARGEKEGTARDRTRDREKEKCFKSSKEITNPSATYRKRETIKKMSIAARE